MDRTAVLEKLQPMTNISARQVEHNTRTRVLVMPEQVVIRPGGGGHTIPLSQDGVKAMADFVDLPKKVCDRLSPDTFGRVTTELLGRKERYNLIMAEGEVQGFADYRGIKSMPVERVLSTIERVIPNPDYYRVSTLENNRTAALEIVGAKQETVRRGDTCRAGQRG